MEHRDQALWLLHDLAPACPHDIPTGELQVEVAPTVGLESERMIVRSAAVGFDNETSGGSVKVDLVSGDEAVDDRSNFPVPRRPFAHASAISSGARSKIFRKSA